MPSFRTAYGPKEKIQHHSRTGKGAVQSFKNECDINRIMSKYQKTGAVNWLSKYEGAFADIGGYDFMDAMETVLTAQSMFNDLPSSVRARFANDPAMFLDFINNRDNLEEARKLGLAKPAPAEEAPSETKAER